MVGLKEASIYHPRCQVYGLSFQSPKHELIILYESQTAIWGCKANGTNVMRSRNVMLLLLLIAGTVSSVDINYETLVIKMVHAYVCYWFLKGAIYYYAQSLYIYVYIRYFHMNCGILS